MLHAGSMSINASLLPASRARRQRQRRAGGCGLGAGSLPAQHPAGGTRFRGVLSSIPPLKPKLVHARAATQHLQRVTISRHQAVPCKHSAGVADDALRSRLCKSGAGRRSSRAGGDSGRRGEPRALRQPAGKRPAESLAPASDLSHGLRHSTANHSDAFEGVPSVETQTTD